MAIRITDLPGVLPASVTVVFPRADFDVAALAPYTRTVTLASLDLDEFAGALTHPGSKPIHSSCVAGYRGGGTPANAAPLQTLARQIATDWYRWQLAKADLTFAGVAPWAPEGMSDFVEWVQGDDRYFTRLRRAAFNAWNDRLLHASKVLFLEGLIEAAVQVRANITIIDVPGSYYENNALIHAACEVGHELLAIYKSGTAHAAGEVSADFTRLVSRIGTIHAAGEVSGTFTRVWRLSGTAHAAGAVRASIRIIVDGYYYDNDAQLHAAGEVSGEMTKILHLTGTAHAAAQASAAIRIITDGYYYDNNALIEAAAEASSEVYSVRSIVGTIHAAGEVSAANAQWYCLDDDPPGGSIVECSLCQDNQACDTYSLAVTGFITGDSCDDCESLNTEHILTGGGCQWYSEPFEFCGSSWVWKLFEYPPSPGDMCLALCILPSESMYLIYRLSGGPHACLEPMTLTWTGESFYFCGDFPSTLTVTPEC